MKYKPSFNDFQQQGGCHKLEKDGFKRSDIMGAFHTAMKGANQVQKREVLRKFYDRAAKD